MADMKTILLVEDDALIAMDEEATLRKHGFNVITALTGEEAVSIAGAVTEIDLVLMDIDLGDGMDGTEAARRILNARDIPVVFLSSHTEPEVVEKTEAITSYGYVVKNSGETVLIASIKMAFKLHGAYCDLRERKEELRESEEKYRFLVENIADVIYTQDDTGRIIYISPAIERLSGYAADEINGRHFTNFVHPDDLPGLVESYTHTVAGLLNPYEFRIFDKNCAIRHVRTLSMPVMVDGHFCGLTGVMSDITERKLAELQREADAAALRRSEEKLRNIIETHPDGVAICDMNGRFIEVNPSFLEMLGYASAEIIGKHYSDITPPGWHAFESGMAAHMREKGFARYDKEYIRKDGAVFPIEIIGWISGDGVHKYSMAFVHDITERKHMETALRSGEERFRKIFDLSPVGSVIVDMDGKFLQCNNAFCEFLGYAADELVGKRVLDVTYRDDTNIILPHFPRISCGEVESMRSRKRYVRRDGRVVWGEVTVRLIHDKNGQPVHVLAIIQDVDERKCAEEELKKSSALIFDLYNNAPCGYHSVNADGLFIQMNDTELSWLGYERDDVIGKMRITDILADTFKPVFNNAFPIYRKRGYAYDIEYEFIRQDGTAFPVLLNSTVVYDDDGNFSMSRATVFDITERKRVEDVLSKALDEKDALLRELQHRVKNNLAMMTSMVQLEMRRTDDDTTRAALARIRDRINSSANLYAMIFETGNTQNVRCDEYVRRIVTALSASYHSDAVDVLLEIQNEPAEIDAKRAVPFGLIANELVTNAFKYAFVDGRKGVVIVRVSSSGGYVGLEVADNGIGLSDDCIMERSKGLGMKLVDMLTKQLGGTITFEREGGTTFRISIPVNS